MDPRIHLITSVLNATRSPDGTRQSDCLRQDPGGKHWEGGRHLWASRKDLRSKEKAEHSLLETWEIRAAQHGGSQEGTLGRQMCRVWKLLKR